MDAFVKPMNATLEDGTIEASNNPIVDDHIIYSATLMLLMFVMAGRYWGLGRWWEAHTPAWICAPPWVRRMPMRASCLWPLPPSNPAAM